jgi:2Fe-2S ferredoxin
MNRTVEARAGETLLEIALSNDIPIQHACGGFCACTTCKVQVQDGSHACLESMEEEEQERLSYADGVDALTRLSCQSKVVSDLTVQVVNLDL